MNESELEKALKQKGKQINPNDPVSSLKQFIKIRPVGIRNIQIITEDLKNFQLILTKLSEKLISQLISTICQSDAEVLIDYLHKFMQFAGQQNISTGNALNIQQEIVKKFGPGIIIQAVSREDTINVRIRNFTV